ncbi:MAG TPA: single-stranded-DNA-specific exonuclease RecJ, partial [Collinsella sp.]|nr:single-stranded-DNA-specific exonuclease RecJ [Collinsella sp.]
GNAPLHDKQREVLEHLAAGRSTMCVMATGRGKSLIFHVHAARCALRDHVTSVFVYPLRALIADQAFHLNNALSRFGITTSVLTGESSPEERRSIYASIAQGECDIVLTTPEYLSIHVDDFAASGRIGFVVIDEAHHIGLAKAGARPAYREFDRIVTELGNPTVLALTATASSAVARDIANLLPLEICVYDQSERANLQVDDRRGLKTRDDYLANLVATGEKTVIYVNSRDQSVALAKTLRKRVPDCATHIAFYNAGLARSDRRRVEEAFRDGSLSCIVSTSAFGEGVNLPDIRHVVLYHMPFGAIEFNQMSGRAGRDGQPAVIHLLYSSRDARINERLLDCYAPERDELVTLYRALQTMWRSNRGKTGDDSFCASDIDIAQMCLAIDARTPVDERSVASGLGIFEELGFCHVSGFDDTRRIAMTENPGRVQLSRSIRYLEGLRSRMEFSAFRSWALDSCASDMLTKINRPIVPRA